MSIADPPNGQLPQAQLATFFCWLHAPVPRRPLHLFLGESAGQDPAAMPEHYCRVKWDDVVKVIKSGDHRLMRDDLAGQGEQEDCTMAGIGGRP